MRPRTRSLALQPLAYSKADAAVIAGVGLSTIKDAVKHGELPEVEKRGRRLILHEDLNDWLLRDRVIRGNGSEAARQAAEVVTQVTIRDDLSGRPATEPPPPAAAPLAADQRRRRGRPTGSVPG